SWRLHSSLVPLSCLVSRNTVLLSVLTSFHLPDSVFPPRPKVMVLSLLISSCICESMPAMKSAASLFLAFFLNASASKPHLPMMVFSGPPRRKKNQLPTPPRQQQLRSKTPATPPMMAYIFVLLFLAPAPLPAVRVVRLGAGASSSSTAGSGGGGWRASLPPPR